MNLEHIMRTLPIRPIAASYVPLSREQVQLLEQRLNATLPEDYEAFLGIYGHSGFCGLATVESVESGHPFALSILYGGGPPGQSVHDVMVTFRDRMPDSMIPIGCDLFGNQFCLGVTGADRGAVYFWDHELEPDPEDYQEEGLPVPPDVWYENLTRIADTFGQFLGQITVEKE